MPSGRYKKSEEHCAKISASLKGRCVYDHSNKPGDFWAMVGKKSEDECWEWMGYKDKGGYGRIRFNSRKILVHRLAYELIRGDIPKELFVMHLCNNPSCCNPMHLKLGSHLENMEYMRLCKRGHYNPGEESGVHKLTENEVLEIRDMYSTKSYRYKDIANKYHVCISTIQLIVKRKTWKHI